MRVRIVVAVTLMLVVAAQASAQVNVDNLRCEYMRDPVGIDAPKPRLSWILQSEDRGQKQTAYHVLVAATPEALAQDRGDLWDSEKVPSDQTVHVEYAGKRLASRMRCHWKVRVWGKDGQPSPWSSPALWTMGLLAPQDWQAQWIGAIADRPERTADQRNGLGAVEMKNPPYAAVLLRKEVSLVKKPVRATAHICGLGYNELSINGKKVGDHVLDPGFTDYTQRNLYVTYDVTELLPSGRSAISVILGSGWFDSPAMDTWKFHLAPWISPPKLLLNIAVEYADGTSETIVSDASWKCSTGPIVFTSIRGGETYDARREKPGWNGPGYDDSGWPAAQVVPAPSGRLMPQVHPPIRVTESIRPVAITGAAAGRLRFRPGAEHRWLGAVENARQSRPNHYARIQ